MASLQSPVSPAAQVSTSTLTSTKQGPPRKLRDSCYNCAISKLRCSKEKPTCARCMRQGKTCGYVPSKRAGRTQTMRSDGKGSGNASRTSPPPTTQAASSSEHLVDVAPATMSPDSIHMSMAQPSTSFQDMLPGLFSYAEETSLPSPSTYTPQFFDMTAISMPWSIFEPVGSTSSPQADTIMAHTFTDSCLQQSLFPTPKSSMSVLDQAIVQDTSMPSMGHGNDMGAQFLPTPTDLPSDPQCSCMSRALELFRQLSSEHSEGARPPSRTSQTAQNIAINCDTEGNKKHVKAILDMLGCSCSEDPYLVHLMCLLVFKIMSLYKSAIQRGDQSEFKEEHRSGQEMELSPNKGGHRAADEDRIRITAQSFFGELHLVQRLISMLSDRLKSFGARNLPTESTSATEVVAAATGIARSHSKDENGCLSLPVTLLHQLEVDLRRRLRTLSGEIVDIIRDG